DGEGSALAASRALPFVVGGCDSTSVIAACPLHDRFSSECVAKLFAASQERNYRIRPNSTLNRYCALALVLESILLNLVVKIVLQHVPSESGSPFAILLCRKSAISGCEQMQQIAVVIRSPRRRWRAVCPVR